MEYIFILELTDRQRADNLAEYLNYSGIPSKVEFNEESGAYRILVDKSRRSDAKKYMSAFFIVEAEEKAQQKDKTESQEDVPEETKKVDEFDWERDDEEADVSENDASSKPETEDDSSDDESDSPFTSTGSYVPKSEKYQNFKSSAWTFITFSILAAVFLVLNVLGVLNIYSTTASQIILGGVVIACLGIGLWCLKGINKLKTDAESEDDFTETLTTWLNENITEEFVNEHKIPDASNEVNYMKLNDAIKELINNYFGEIDDAYLDTVIDSFYSEKFENAENSEEEE